MTIDYRRVIIALVRGAARRGMVQDEGAIVGWATTEEGEHYPIHEAESGGAKFQKTMAKAREKYGKPKGETFEHNSKAVKMQPVQYLKSMLRKTLAQRVKWKNKLKENPKDQVNQYSFARLSTQAKLLENEIMERRRQGKKY